MTVELQWFNSLGTEIDEDLHPLDMIAGTSYVLALRNVGTTTAKNVGFYLKLGTVDPVAEIGTVYPSTHGILIDLYEILNWGSLGSGFGYSIIQHGVPTIAVVDHGDSAQSPIVLSKSDPLLSGDDELAPDEEVNITVMLVVNPITAAQRKYIDLDVTYTSE